MSYSMINVSIGEFCPFIYGKALKAEDRKNGKIPVYGSNGIVGYHNEYLVNGPGIIIGRKGSVGELHLSEEPFWVIDTAFYISGYSIDELRYLFYQLKALNLDKMNSDSAVPGLNRDNAHSRIITIPKDSKIREKIGNEISKYDYKLKCNNNINQTLESISQTLFKSWFVDFDPVKAKIAAKEQGDDPQLAAMMAISGKSEDEINQMPAEKRKQLAETADLFPDEMMESELGEIPKGWKVRKIGEIYQTTSGGTPSRDKKHFFENGTIDWVKSKELTYSFVHKTEEKITKEAILNSSAKLLPPNTILLAMYGATVGQFAILGMPAACNQAICAILPNETYPYSFIYSWLKENKENVMGRASGSAQQNISQLIIKGIDIIVPRVELIGIFHTKVGKSFDLLLSNIKENQTLSNLRDELLPQLLAGNIILEDGGVI